MLNKTNLALTLGLAWSISPNAALAQQSNVTPNIVQAQSVTTPTLPTITVTETRDDEKGYQGAKTRLGKTAQLAKDIPQSVTIVSSQLMQERNADTFKEALRNVAGLTFNAGEGGRIGDNITLRGYSTVGDLYLDGVRDIAQYNRETFNLEQIDVLRGSASMLYGKGSTGGVINQVSKTAQFIDKNQAEIVFGSYNYKRATVDINHVINDDLAFRVNAMGTNADSFRDGVRTKRIGFAPTVTYSPNNNDELILAYFYEKDNNVPDYGIPYVNGKPLNVPINRFYGLANADYERTETSISTLTYTHRLDNDSSIRTLLRKADYDRDLRATAPRVTGAPTVGGITTVTDNTTINRQRQARGGQEHTITGQFDFNTLFTTGTLKHEVLTGAEYLKEKANRWTKTSSLANPTTTIGAPDNTPILPSNFDNSFTRTAPNSYVGETYSAYLQDTIEFIPHWKILLGTRFDNMHADYLRSSGGPLSRNDNVWSYRSGLMYQPNKYHTYYVSYGTSFNPSAEAYQLDDRSTNTPPEKNRNIEIGAKWELMDGDLSLRTALFRSEKTNERNTDVASPDQYLLTGKRHTDGIELEVAGRVTSAWEVFTNIALMSANIDKAAGTSAGNKNKVPVNTPNNSYSLWNTYKLGQWQGGKWKIGMGLEGVGKRYANAANSIALDAYQRVDGLLQYDTPGYTAKFNVFNMFNTTYYEGVYTGHTTPGTPRSMQVTLLLKF